MTDIAQTHTSSLATSVRCSGCQLPIDVEPSTDELTVYADIRFSDRLLNLLADGQRVPMYPNLIRGIKRLRDQREFGIARRYGGCCGGLPQDFPREFFQAIPRDFRRIALADLETLSWRCYLLRYTEHLWLPMASDELVMESLRAHDLRAWLGRSQSFVNKYAALFPRADVEEYGQGVELEIPTREFFRIMNARTQRVMRSRACMRHLRIG